MKRRAEREGRTALHSFWEASVVGSGFGSWVAAGGVFKSSQYPHTLFLAAARFVLSPEYRQHNSLQDQANDANILLYLSSPTRARDPFPQHVAGDDATYQRIVQTFAERLKEWGSIYEKYAEMERPLIETTSKFLSKFTTCRAPTAAKQSVLGKD